MKSLAVLLLATTAFAQTQIRCGTLIDGRSDTPRRNVTITIQGNKITGISEAAPAANAIDLSNSTCLPGLIDTHTHIVLQGDIIVDYDEQLLKQSDPYRAIRATVAARRGLEFGFTAMRDLETELDRKSTRLNSSHVEISYAVFCLKKKKKKNKRFYKKKT